MSLAEPGEPFESFVTANSRPALGYYVSASGSEEEEGTEYVATPRYPQYESDLDEQNMENHHMEGLTRPNVNPRFDDDEEMEDCYSHSDSENLTRQYMEERQNFPRQLPPMQLSPRSPSTSSISAATISSSPSPTQITNAPFRLYSSSNSPRDFISLQSNRESPISLPPISDSPFIPDGYTTNQSVSSMLRYPPMNHNSNHLSYPPTQNNTSSFSSSSTTTATGSSSTTSNNNTNEQPKQSPLRFGYPDSQDDDEEEELSSSSTTPYDSSSRKRVRTRSNDWANNGTSNRNSSQIYHQSHHTLQFGSFAPRDLHHSSNGNRSSSSIVSSQSSTQVPASVPSQAVLLPSNLQRPPLRHYIDLTSQESSPSVPSFNASYSSSSTSRNTSFVPSFPLGATPSQSSTVSNPTSNTTNASNTMSTSTSSASASSFPSSLPPLQRMTPRSSAPFTAYRTRQPYNNLSGYTSSFIQNNAEFYGGSETQQERNQTTGNVPRLRSTPRWTPRNNELPRVDRETLMRAMNATVQRRLNRTSNNGNNNHQSSYSIGSLQDSTLRDFLSDEEHDVPIDVPDSPEPDTTNNLSDPQWGRPVRRMTQEFARERHSSNFIRSQAIAAVAAAAVNEATAEGANTTSSRPHHSGDRGSFTDAELARRMQAQEYSVMQSQNIIDNMNSLARIIGENGPGPRSSVSSRHSSRRESSSTTSSSARSNSATRERSFRFQSRLAELFTHDHRHHEERSNERSRVGIRSNQSRGTRPEDLLDMLPDVIGNGIMSNPDNYLDDDDFDPSYENLIRLCERNGDVKPKCAPEDAINSLPTKLYSGGGKGKNYEERCSICLTEYEENDKLMSLPCSHDFHNECVVNWLKKHSSSCPICRQQITKSED
ncbi:10560_t:CDS:10 [Ambispora leptoticha]|uniref:10560_t:CDS:1 n=1 Tax=Ambispora leptoticha TaxID=144679 RepID=A0A9N9FGL3_9GLOM|nr:10560_t:CDS:10 [Ambispora leptoticha]